MHKVKTGLTFTFSSQGLTLTTSLDFSPQLGVPSFNPLTYSIPLTPQAHFKVSQVLSCTAKPSKDDLCCHHEEG